MRLLSKIPILRDFISDFSLELLKLSTIVDTSLKERLNLFRDVYVVENLVSIYLINFFP